jgi:hypothetical protein|uniref:Uncharacterized protein n=1 Tax=Picea glauca TaxID=3330 RepID=A0A101LX88_PICGL|nr:hypothetical protein ABT39_MTgene6008 [Picea glauca]QHR86841.1 hypothetical protein Q903MT_gene848 [Picea sitchensis]
MLSRLHGLQQTDLSLTLALAQLNRLTDKQGILALEAILCKPIAQWKSPLSIPFPIELKLQKVFCKAQAQAQPAFSMVKCIYPPKEGQWYESWSQPRV